jgi:predicted Zn-dependent protease
LATGVFLHYSRSAESEADHDGALIMYQAGYNPQALADFFRKLEQQGGQGVPQFLSDHPNPGNRAQAIAQLIGTLPSRQYGRQTGEFQQIHALAMQRHPMTAQQIADQNKRGGFSQTGAAVEGGQETMPAPPTSDIDPSEQLQTLDHSAFTISYPANWQVMGDQSSAVTIAPKSGVTENAVAYGVIINGFQPESQDVDGAMHELEADLRQSNPELRLVGHDDAITVNGVQGRSADMLGNSPIQSGGKAIRERDWVVGIPAANHTLVYLVFIAPDRDFSRLRPTFEQMLRSFRVK